MKTKLVTIIFLLFLIIYSIGQQSVDQDWNGFSQTIDISAYQGGQFRFKGFVKVENASRLSNARLWARVDKKNGMTFNENMYQRPILSNIWSEYLIEGSIDKSAISLRVGGLIFGNSKYQYDKLTLEVRKKNGSWENLKLANGDFESEIIPTEWKPIYNIRGYDLRLTSEDVFEGQKSLLIDASERTGKGKIINANGINIYYEESGKGDTILLLHGNSQSVKAFKKQIPELSKSFYVIAMDSRGQGNSSEDGNILTYELMAEDVNSLLEKLNFEKVNILGWSDGGNTGLILAMKHPEKVKRLATMGANLYNDQTSIGDKFNKMIKNDRAELVVQNNPYAKFQIRLIDLMLKELNIKPDDLKNIKCPTLIMAGSKDIIKDGHTRLIASKIEKSKLIIFDKGTHFIPDENPGLFNKMVIDFFKDK